MSDYLCPTCGQEWDSRATASGRRCPKCLSHLVDSREGLYRETVLKGIEISELKDENATLKAALSSSEARRVELEGRLSDRDHECIVLESKLSEAESESTRLREREKAKDAALNKAIDAMAGVHLEAYPGDHRQIKGCLCDFCESLQMFAALSTVSRPTNEKGGPMLRCDSPGCEKEATVWQSEAACGIVDGALVCVDHVCRRPIAKSGEESK